MDRYEFSYDLYMKMMRDESEIEDMTFPVRCQCGKAYDLGKVTVTARYADCSIWTTPCCGRQEDDRPWVRRYTEIQS